VNAHGKTVEERLGAIEDELLIIKAQRGRIMLPPSIIVVVWGILVAAISCVIFIVRLDTRVTDLTTAIARTQSALEHHTDLPWHAAAGEKYNALDKELQRVEERLNAPHH
jgi:hypothetical protein